MAVRLACLLSLIFKEGPDGVRDAKGERRGVPNDGREQPKVEEEDAADADETGHDGHDRACGEVAIQLIGDV